MPADTAKYLLTIADLDPKNVEITVFSGVDAISAPYRFDVEFRMSGTTKVPPPDNSLLNKSCRLDIERNGETIPYCGIAVGFSVSDYDDARYTVRIAPRMYRLSLNSTSRIFQNLTVPEIIKNIVYEAELSDYFRIELEPDDIKYPKREYCVQYHESDLAFISRLMEECGIWYYFEQVRQPSGALNECAVVTDVFSEYPKLGRTVPFMKGSGFSEKKDGQLVESVNYLSTKAKLMPRSVRIRNYNHRTPEAAPDGSGDVTGGHLGRVYDYGGAPKNSSEAEHRAGICANRLWVENLRVDGRGNCASFRAGLQAPIMHNSNAALSGLYLLVSVKHSGGWNNGAYTYKNDFSSVRAEPEIYAPPLRTPVPRIDGITTALVGATGDAIPTINECGDYNVNMPFLLNDDKQINNDYGGTKHIRVAQPSSGITAEEERLYGIHFPSKRGAEMVLAYVNGNPDKPVGLGFVPNAAAPSVARNVNCVDNVMRSWGGNELVMNDSHSRENIRLSTPTVRYLELHDGDEFARLKSADSELIFHDAENYAEINVGGHTIHIIYRDKEGDISATTVDGNMIKMNDPENVITVQNAEEENKAVLDGENKTITFDSVENTLTIYGDDKKIALESKDSKAAIDGSGKKVSFESKDNSLVISGASNSISLNAKGDIILKAGGKIIFDAKSGVSNIGASIDVDPDGSGPGNSPSVVSEQKAASANVRSAARAESGTKNAAGTDGAGGTETGKSSPKSTTECKTGLFYFVSIETQFCVDSSLNFCRSLAVAYAKILVNSGAKIFLRGNTFLAKITKAIFEQNGDLFAETCKKYKDKEYFNDCVDAMNEWNFSVNEGSVFNNESWLGLYKVVLLLTEEYLATKCELPIMETFECTENSDAVNSVEIILTPQSMGEADIKEAELIPLEDRPNDSSDSIIADELFYDFLCKNFPFRNNRKKFIDFMENVYGEDVCKNLDWFYDDVNNNTIPQPNIEITAIKKGRVLGSCKEKTISINQRLVLDALSMENPESRFILFLTMLTEYGLFLGNVLRKRVGCGKSESDNMCFTNMFMVHSCANLFNDDFTFAKFIAFDAKKEKQIFTVMVSDLNYEQRKDIFYILGIKRI